MARRADKRLTDLEKSSTDDDVIVIFDLTEGKIWHQDEEGNYRQISSYEYHHIKDKVITVRVYADV